MLKSLAVFLVAVLLTAVMLSGAPALPRSATAATCPDYLVQALAQVALQADPTDPGDLDGDDDNGVACEDLPCPCLLEPVNEAIGDEDEPSETPTALITATVASRATATPTAVAPTIAPTLSPTVVPAASSRISPPSTGDGGLAAARE